MALGIALFLLPNQLSSGGFSGIATVIYYIFKIPMGTTILVLNIPLFLFSRYKIGREFFLKAILGTVSLSIFIDIFDKYNPITDDRFLACIYGGIIIGLGSALTFKAGSSTGGSDIITNIIKKYNSNISISKYLVIIDIIVISINVIVFKEVEIGLYSAIAIYLYGQMIDIVFEGVNYTKLLFIISDKNEQISEKIEKEVQRGVTGLYGKGMYRNKDKLVLICAASRRDISKIKELAKKIDKKSFIIVANVREALGEGFKT